jgi:hypothetical protein
MNIEVRWDFDPSSFIFPLRFGTDVLRPGFGIVRVDVPIDFRRRTNRKAKRQRCKARRRARLKAQRTAAHPNIS